MSTAGAGGPTEDDWKKITKLVDQFYNRADAEPFRAPVDWKNLGLTDYPKIITHPMDLGTIKTHLRGSKKKDAPRHYKNLMQVSKDVHQVWTNCTLYNADGSDFYKLAASLRKKWEDRFKKVLSECSPGAARGGDAAGAATKKSAPTPDKSKPSSGAAAAGGGNSNDMNSTSFPPPTALPAPNAAPKTTIQDRRAFAKSLYSLTKEDLGKVLVELEVKCPAAMRRNAAEDEVELNIDKISPPSAFMELKKMIDHFIATSSAQRKTTKSGGGGGGAGAASSKKAKTK